MILTMLYGFSMALADSVPGVSGGTIAFIMGFYDQLLTALNGLLGKEKSLRNEAMCYLVKFAAGWCVGMGACVLLLSHIFETQIYFMSSLFLGLTAAAIPFICYEERETLKGKMQYLIFTVLGAVLVILLTVFRTSTLGIGGVDFQSLNLLQCGYLLVCGLLAVSAMLLPGISGSTLLLILGVYVPLIHAAKAVLQFQLAYLPGVIAVALGIGIGILFASGLIRKALRKYRPQMVYLILGLMAGSLYAIVMGPATLEAAKPPVDIGTFQIPAFLLGAVILAGLEWFKGHTTKNICLQK